MTIEKGSLKDWDDRHYQSIDDLPPEAWDAVRDDFQLNNLDAHEHDAAREILQFCQTGDSEIDHVNRDRLMIKFLRGKGFNEVADAAEYVEDKVGFWYA